MNWNGTHSNWTFEINGRYYIFDIAQMIYFELNERQYKYLKNPEKNLIMPDDIALFSQLKANDLFFTYKEPAKQAASRTVTFSIPVKHGCNLSCRYCFTKYAPSATDMPPLTSVLISEAAKFIKNNFPAFDYRFEETSGGEPLIDKEKLFLLIRNLREEFLDKNLSIWICTNGTLLTVSDIQNFTKYNVNYGISIDGNEVQNSLRLYPNNTSSYCRVTNNIKAVLNSPDIPRKMKEIWGLSVISTKNFNLETLLLHLKSLGFKTIQMRIVRGKSSDEWVFTKENVELLLTEIANLFFRLFQDIESNEYQLLSLLLNDSDFIGKILIRLLLKEPATSRCDAGSTRLAITTSGDIYPCESFVGLNEYCLGSIYRGWNAKANIFETTAVNAQKKCHACEIRFVCGGDCFHNSLLKNGVPDSHDEVICQINKYIVKLSIDFLWKLKAQNSALYQRLKRFARIRIHKQR